MIGTITLNPSIDQHILVKNLLKDDANRAQSIVDYPGGKGINVSKVVRELGGPTHAYAILGGRTGGMLRDLAEKLDFPLSWIATKGDTRVNTIITDCQDNTQTRISAPGPKINSKDLVSFKRMLLSAKCKPSFWALGGSLSTGMAPSTYREIILMLQKRGTPCILDTDNEALKLGIQAKPFMIKPNEYEIQRLLNKSFHSIQDYLKAAQTLVRGGIKIVIVSLAKRGALFVTSTQAIHATTPQVPVKSKVGAGDSLIGGFLFGLYRKLDLIQAAKLGIAASASAVMREAPRLCVRSDIKRLVSQVSIHEYVKSTKSK